MRQAETQAQQISRVPDTEETLTAADGIKLHYYEWRPTADPGQPEATPRGAILLMHGFGEHLGRYGRLARAFNAEGFLVGGIDHRGMGQSEGARAYVSDFRDYMNDATVAEKRLESALPANAPLFVYGHSMGGLVALMHAEYCATSHAVGTILSAPMLGIAMPVPKWQVALGKRLAKRFPKLGVPVKLPSDQLMHDPDERVLHAADPMNLKRTTLAWFFQSEHAMLWTRRNIPNVAWPTLWLIPGDDLICSSRTAAAVYKMLPDFGDHTLHEYPGLYHELHNESPNDRDRVFSDTIVWLNAHIRQ